MAASGAVSVPVERSGLTGGTATLPPVAAGISYPTASLAAQAYLADGFRADQAYLAAQVIARVLGFWKLLNLRDVRSSWPPLQQAIAAVIREQFAASARAGTAYYRESRLAAGVTGDLPDLAVPAAPPDSLIQAVTDATGPYRLLASIKSATQPLADAYENAGVVLSGASMRVVLSGGRQAVLSAVQDDPEAVAWMRVTAAGACAFCAMLAGRGAVFKSEATAGFPAHGHCRCQAQPVFSEPAAKFLTESNPLRKQWDQVTAGLSGKDALNAWRRHWYGANPGAVGAPRAA